MNKIPILPKNFIKNIHDLQQHECRVCFQVQPNVMRCSGPCKSALCLTCATSICLTTKEASCPQRCCPQLILEPIPGLKLLFHCPYEREKCKAVIEGRQAFAEHCLTCEYISTEALSEHLKSEVHVCHKDHPLLFLDREVTNHFFHQASLMTLVLKCEGCGEKKFCRSYCAQCSTEEKHIAFCHDCRALPCTKQICPNGHHVFVKREADPKYYCDMCGQCIYLISDQCYIDADCDIGVCIPCYQRLPETHQLVPLQSNIAHWQKHGKPHPPYYNIGEINQHLPANHYGLIAHNYFGGANFGQGQQSDSSAEEEQEEQEGEQAEEGEVAENSFDSEPEQYNEDGEEQQQDHEEEHEAQDEIGAQDYMLHQLEPNQEQDFQQVQFGQNQDQQPEGVYDDHDDYGDYEENW